MKVSFPVSLLVVGLLAGASLAVAQVPFDRIVNAASEPGNWLTQSGNYASHRYSDLDEITAENVDGLRVEWIYQFRDQGLNETTPLAVDGVLFVTEAEGRVTALDASTGSVLWTWTRPLPEDLITIGFPHANRGAAILGETLYVGTLDAWLFALDARSGAVRWKSQVADNLGGYSITMAPLAIDGKIIVGVSGGETGIRGFVDAYDAISGKRAWRWWTIPGEGEPGNETWAGDSWKTGAGATWLTGSYDPQLDLLYWGIGNPGPDWNGDARLGDNLYTCSVVALDPEDGRLVWHFQHTPHDVHDWDSNQILVLADAEIGGRERKLILQANRNAFYYVLDRETGEFLHAEPYVKQTWAERIDERGRPIVLPNTEPTEEGNLVYPSLQGATNWPSPSYDRERQSFFVGVREMGAYYFKSEVDYEPGRPFMGGGERALKGDAAYGAVRSLDALTGELRWEFRLQTPLWSGLLSTAGGLVFGGSNEGSIYALDSDTGVPLWSLQTGGAMRSNPMAFEIGGRQRVAISSGGALFVLGLP